jgi:GR25 family glycosyltransferase involved in LPS biosynthesis/glycosyltransferase involved in cell wall biosynthesis
MQKKTICLNMIVKNESSIIIETLKNLCNYINFDYWVISDTGSTDNTKEIICDFFKDKGIVGELVEHEWKDFGYNRTKALECAFNKTDYLLIFDADDKLEGNFNLPKLMDKDSYGLKFGKDFAYYRTLIITNRKKWIYKGVLHEYIQCIDVNITDKNIVDGDYYVVSGRSGNRSKNPNKYLDDAIILSNAFNKEMNEINGDKGLASRYAFYCAQSYKDSGNMYTTDAIEWYKKVLTLDNWVQEKYYACLKIGELCNSLNKTDEALVYWISSSEYDNERIEGIVNAMECLRLNNKHTQVNELYHKFKNYNKNVSNDKLFVDKTKYNDLIEYNNSISAFYVPGEKQSGYECCKKIITNNTIGKVLMDSTLSNIIYYKDFVDQNISSDVTFYTTYILKNTTNPISQSQPNEPTTLQSSPRFSNNECRKSKNILFYTGFSNENWNYSYMLNNSLGGSEKAVAYLTKLFPKEYTIYISGGVANEHFDNITYIHLNELQNVINTTPFHTIICSRYISFLEMFQDLSFYKFYIWAHDTSFLPYGCKLTSQQIITKWNKYIDGCICQTNWHANHYKKIYPELTDKINIINNGIDTSLFTANTANDFGHKRTNKFIYTSCSERGLFVLLKMWPNILEIFSDATLVISSYNNFPKNNDDIEMKKIIDNYPNSIVHLGKLSSDKLYQEMYTADYWLYPTSYCETSCITSMEMLANGVICIYYPVAGLVDTIKDYGIPVNNTNEVLECLNKLSSEPNRKNEIRQRGITYAFQDCSWSNRVNEWSNLTLKNKMIQIVNLKRREDKKNQMTNRLNKNGITNYEFVEAVDGTELQPTVTLKKLFANNNFNYRKGVIGCALSHYNLWHQLINDADNQFYFIFEDDSQLCNGFNKHLLKINDAMITTDIIFVGYSRFNQSQRKVVIEEFNTITEDTDISLQKINQNKYSGGTFSYSINKTGAKKMIDHINTFGVRYAIDFTIILNSEIDCYETIPSICVSYHAHDSANIDTDIQSSHDCLDFKI